MNPIEESHSNFSHSSFADKINEHLSTSVCQVYAAALEVTRTFWIGLATAICVIGLVIGFSVLLKIAIWILIAGLTLLAIAYGVGFAREAKPNGVMGASGKLPALSCVLAATLLFVLLPASTHSTKPHTDTSSNGDASPVGSTSAKDATLAYWNSISLAARRCKKTAQKFNLILAGKVEAEPDANPFDEMRREILGSSNQINSLSLTNVDPAGVELGIEFDSILSETIDFSDETMKFLASQFTAGGMIKALFVGTKAEEAQLSEREKHLRGRLLRWEEECTKTRIELSKRFSVTFPPMESRQ